MLGQISFTGLVALDEMLAGGDRGELRHARPTRCADAGPGPVAAYEVEEMREQPRRRRSAASPSGRRPCSALYYYEGLTLAEIGSILGVTESRVCQIHTKAVLQLRARLSPRPSREPA